MELQRNFDRKGPDAEDRGELERLKRLKEKLKQQKKKEEEYRREKERREEELLSIEKHYKSLNEEVDEMRQRSLTGGPGAPPDGRPGTYL